MVMPASQPWPHPAYRIETERLVVRCYTPGDAAELTRAVAASQRHLAAWVSWADQLAPLAHNVELLRRFRGRFDLGDDFTYGIYDATTSAQVGGTGLHARVGPHALEIGYWIAGDRVCQGLATEAAAALTRVGFEVMGARRLHIHCEPANVASARVPAKLGYVREGLMRWRLLQPDGSLRDTLVHTLTADEYPTSPAATAPIRAYDVAGRELLN